MRCLLLFSRTTDLYYIKNMSLLLDLCIMMKTLKIIVLGKGAR